MSNISHLGMTDSIKYIKETHEHNFNREEIGTRDRIYFETFEENPEDMPALKFAKGFARFLAEKKILINEYDILAGFAYRYSYNSTIPLTMSDDYDPRYRPASPINLDLEIEKCIEFYGLKDNGEEVKKLRTFASGVKNWLYKHWTSGHIIPDYEKLLTVGYGGLIDEGEKALAAETDATKKGFIEAMLITDKAAAEYIMRYSRMALEIANKTTNLFYKERLIKISKACANIAVGVPTGFFEAVQLVWLTQEMLLAETIPASQSLGRMDKYLYPFYKMDFDADLITYAAASEIIDALWIKFSANIHAYQNVTLGGYDENGDYLANDVTYMCMEATRRLRFDQPLISVRWNKKMPDRLWQEVVALIQAGNGFPALFNDDRCIAAKIKAGIEQQDALNYAVIGCVELAVPGKEYSIVDSIRINWPEVMELMFSGGQHLKSGETFSLKNHKNLDEIKSFDEFYNWYKDELVHYTNIAIYFLNMLDEILPFYWPSPYISSLMEGCYKKGLDVTAGGTIYNNSPLNTCGMANVVDSLAGIKKVVFDEGLVTLSELAQALRCNFDGYEELHNELLNNCLKFGNDIDEVDWMMTDLVGVYINISEKQKNPRGGVFQMGVYSVEDHTNMGMNTGALPDGRLVGVAFANSTAPVQGMDHQGPTAVINSVLKSRASESPNGMVLDLKFNPKFFDKESHKTALKALILSYFQRGGMEIQFNVIDRETLIDAQLHPEKHKDLVIRVSGFSAYFCTLRKATQDEIIARTEYGNI